MWKLWFLVFSETSKLSLKIIQRYTSVSSEPKKSSVKNCNDDGTEFDVSFAEVGVDPHDAGGG